MACFDSRRYHGAMVGKLAVFGLLAVALLAGQQHTVIERILSIAPPKGSQLPLAGATPATPEISPDGASIIFSGRTIAPSGAVSDMLYVHRLGDGESKPLRGTESANHYFWSPDSKSIIFVRRSSRTMLKMRVQDGAPEAITEMPGLGGSGTWTSKATILFAAPTPGVDPGLYHVPASGGKPMPLDLGDLKSGIALHPESLPNGEDFLFVWAPDGSDEVGVYLAAQRDGPLIRSPTLLRKNAAGYRYSSSAGGRLLFVEDDNLYAQRMDLKGRTLRGEPEIVAQGVASACGGRGANFSVSQSGVLSWRPGKVAQSPLTR